MVKVFKKLNMLLLIFVLSLVMVFSACSKTGGSSANQSQASDSTISSENSIPYDKIDRSQYNLNSLKNQFSGYNFKQIKELYDNDELLQLLAGYKLGDVVNSAFDTANEGMPSGSNLSLLYGFSYYSDGNWYNNSTLKKSHKVMNKLLEYELDNSKPLVITEEELNAYGNSKIVDFAGYTASAVTLLNSYNPLFAYLINGTLSQWNSLINGNESEKIIALYNLVGDSKLNDLLKLFTNKIKNGDKITLKEIISYSILSNQIKDNALMVSVANLWLKTESAKQCEFLNSEVTVDGITYSVIDGLKALNSLEKFANDDKFISGEIAVNEHIGRLFNEIDVICGDKISEELDKYCGEILSNPNIGELTIGYIKDQINLSNNQNETTICYAYNVMNYINSSNGQNDVENQLSISDMVVYLSDFFAGGSEYLSLKVCQIASFVNGLKANDLSEFATKQIKDNEEFIRNQINMYAQNSVDFNLTYDKVLELAGLNKEDIVLTESEENCLKNIDIKSMLEFKEISINQVENVECQAFIDSMLELNLYDLICGLDTTKKDSIIEKFSAINPFMIYQLFTTEKWEKGF